MDPVGEPERWDPASAISLWHDIRNLIKQHDQPAGVVRSVLAGLLADSFAQTASNPEEAKKATRELSRLLPDWAVESFQQQGNRHADRR
jgi:hypothetical protein